MAEEALYEPEVIEGGGDPDPKDPLGLRKKLAESRPDPLGLRAKIATPYAGFQLNVSSPTFKPTPVTGANEFNYNVEKPADPFGVTKLQIKAEEAHKHLREELAGNKDVKVKLVKQKRAEEYAAAIPQSRSDQPKTASDLAVERFIQPAIKPQDLPVTDEDIAKEDQAYAADRGKAVRLLEKTAELKPEKKAAIQKSLYILDVANTLGNDEQSAARTKKIEKNAKGIEKGDLTYDARTGQLLRPTGLVGSAIEGFKQKEKLFSDYDFLKNTDNNAAIAMQLDDDRMNHDPDEPIPVPKGKLSEITQGLGSMPLKPLAGGLIAGAVNPVAGVAAGAAIGARENAKLEYAATFKRIYYELLDQNPQMSDAEKAVAVEQARKQAEQSAEVGAVVGGAMGLIGTNLGLRTALPNFSEPFKKAAINLIKQSGGQGLLAGAIGAGGELLKNKLAQNIGINRPIDEGVGQAIEANLLMTVGLAAAIKLGKGVTGPAYKSILHGLSKVPDEVIAQHLDEKVQNGEITPAAADNAKAEISNYKGLDQLIPDDITEDARFKIQDKIKKRAELEQKLENTDKAFHEPIKEKIKSLNEEIVGLSKEKAEPAKPDISLPKEKAKEASEFAEELLHEGLISDMYESAIKKDPVGFWKTIADQANNLDESGKPNAEGEAGSAEQAARDQFGDTVVDYAKELFPAPEIVEPINTTEHAIQEQSAGGVLQHPQEGVGEKGGGRERMEPVEQGEIPAGAQPEEGQNNAQGQEGIGIPPPETPKANVYVERPTTELSHRGLQDVANEFSLPDVQTRERKSDIQLRKDAEITASDWREKGTYAQNIEGLVKDAEAGKVLTDEQRVILEQHLANVSDSLRSLDKNSPEFNEQLKYILRLKEAGEKTRSEAGAALRIPGGGSRPEATYADFMAREAEASGTTELTEQQKAQASKEFEEITKAKDELQAKVDKLEADYARLQAEKTIEKTKAARKPGEKRDYAGQRKQIIEDIREKLKKARGETSIVAVPYAKELIAIAPDVAKLVANLVADGVDKLPAVVKAVHDQIKELLPEITETDVHNIIAGEYNEKKATRNEIAEKLHNLRTEAKLVNRLQELENGIEPKSEKKKIARNREIEELRKKIKEHDLTKLADYKKRTSKQIEELEEKIKKGDFAPDEKKAPLKLDAEAQKLKDELLRLKEEREIRLMKIEYEKRTNLEKAGRLLGEIVGVGRVAKSSFDVSMPMRQGLWGLSSQLLDLPIGDNKGFAKQRQLASEFGKMYTALATEKQYRRIMAEIHESPRYDMAQKAGLNIIDPLSRLEEQRLETHGPTIAEKIPIIGKGFTVEIGGKPVKIGGFSLVQKSERAATTFVNTMKWNIFNNFTDMFEKQGKTFENSPDLYKAAADYANQSVGQGKMPEWLKKASPLTSKFFFSVKLQASRLQLLTYLANPRFYTKVPKEIRLAYMKDMIKFLALGTAIIGTAKAFGLSVGANPYQSNFGKIKVGDTEYDVWGGFSQWATFLSREVGGKSSDKGGHVKDANRLDIVGRFARSKGSPEASLVYNVLDKKNYLGEKTNLKKESIEFVTPLIGKDIYEAQQDGGVQQAIITAILGAHGVSVQTYDHSKKK